MRKLIITGLLVILATAALADTFNPNPLTYRMNILKLLDTAGNVPSAVSSSNVNILQPANGNDTILLQQTSGGTTGKAIHAMNNAETVDSFSFDYQGTGSLGTSGTKQGIFTINGGTANNTATLNIDMTGSNSSTTAGVVFTNPAGGTVWNNGDTSGFGELLSGNGFRTQLTSRFGIELWGTSLFPNLASGGATDTAVTIKTKTAAIDLLDMVNSGGSTVTKFDSSGNATANGYIVAGGANPTGGPVAGDLVAARSATLGSLWLGSGGTTNGGFFQFNAGTYSFQNPAGGTTEFKIDGSGNATSNGFMDAGSYLTTGTEGQHNSANINSQQIANGGDTVWLARNADVGSLGYYVRGINAAQTTAVWSEDVLGDSVNTGSVEVGTALQVDTSVAKDAGGIKHIRVFRSGWASGFSDFGFTWTTPFADNNYTVTCTMVEAIASGHNLQLFQISNKSASGFTMTVQNLNAAPQNGTVGCIAMHD